MSDFIKTVKKTVNQMYQIPLFNGMLYLIIILLFKLDFSKVTHITNYFNGFNTIIIYIVNNII